MRSFFPTSSSFLPSFLPSIPPTFRFRSVSSFFTSSPVHPFHLRSPSQSILTEHMPSFHPEQGKTLLAEVLFLRHSVDIRCPSCPGNPGCPGHTRDQGGKATKAGGTWRVWKCRKYAGKERLPGSKCSNVSNTGYIDLAKIGLDPDVFYGVVEEIYAKLTETGQERVGLNRFRSRKPGSGAVPTTPLVAAGTTPATPLVAAGTTPATPLVAAGATPTTPIVATTTAASFTLPTLTGTAFATSSAVTSAALILERLSVPVRAPTPPLSPPATLVRYQEAYLSRDKRPAPIIESSPDPPVHQSIGEEGSIAAGNKKRKFIGGTTSDDSDRQRRRRDEERYFADSELSQFLKSTEARLSRAAHYIKAYRKRHLRHCDSSRTPSPPPPSPFAILSTSPPSTTSKEAIPLDGPSSSSIPPPSLISKTYCTYSSDIED